MPRVYHTRPSPPICSNSHAGALVGVLDLVVRQVDGFRVGHGGIDGDGLDAGRLRLVEGRVERLGVERIEHDRVHVGRDQVTDVGKLALGIGVPVDPGARLDLTRLECLGLGRAELLLAEAVADAERVREADRVRAAAARRSRTRAGSDAAGADAAGGSDAAGSEAGAAVPPLLEQAAATTARTAMPTSSRDLIIPVLLLLCATSHSRRVDQWMPRHGGRSFRLFLAPPARVVRGHQASPPMARVTRCACSR